MTRHYAGDCATARRSIAAVGAEGSSGSRSLIEVRRWESACQKRQKANLALVSVAGEYAAELAERGAGSFVERDDLLR